MEHTPSFQLKNIALWVRTYRFEIALFVLAFAFRLSFVGLASPADIALYGIGADGGDYANEALNILEGRGFSRDTAPPYTPDAIRTPLYPLVLAGVHALFGSFLPIMFIQAFLAGFIPLIGLWIARMYIESRRVQWGIALFLALEPHLAFYTTFFASEGISLPLLYAGLFSLLVWNTKGSTKYLALSAFLLGLSALTRPITFLFPLFLMSVLTLSLLHRGWREHARRAVRGLILFSIIFVAILSPWLIRNYIHFGSGGMGTVGWFNVYTRLAATVRAMETKEDFYTSYHFVLDDLSTRGYVAHSPPVSEREIQDPRFGEILKKESLRIISEHPRELIAFLAVAPISVITQDNILVIIETLTGVKPARPPFSPTLYVGQHGVIETIHALLPYIKGLYIIPYVGRMLWGAMFILSCAGAYILWVRRERFAAALLFCMILYIVAFSLNAGAQIDGRYRTQFILCEAVLVGVALERLLHIRKKRSV